MDRNLFLACVLSLAVVVGWIYFTGGAERRPESGGNTPTQSQTADSSGESSPEAPPSETLSDFPEAAEVAPPIARPQAKPVEIDERRIQIEMPLYSVELTNRGAGISRWTLKNFREASDRAAPLVDLTTAEVVGAISFATPFAELGLGDFRERVFEVTSEDLMGVSFESRDAGIAIRKSFSFEPDSYAFRLLVEVINQSTTPVAPRFQIDLPAHQNDANDFREQALAALEEGSRVTTPLRSLGRSGFFQSITGRKAEPYKDYVGRIDWAGVQTTYFLTAILPDNPSQARVRMAALEPGVSGATQLSFEETAIPPGRSVAREFRAYMGPKETARLEAFGGETVRAVDLGWSWVQPLTRFFAWLLEALHAIVPNYGIAIIILTIAVRAVTAPLTIKQMRSMERMRALSPKLKEIQAQYADDRQKQSEKTMALYRSEGVNPLGGCLPMILQFPVFIGLFYALRSAIQLRQAPFFGWIDDLSAPESLFDIPGIGIPFRVLPLIMGATMVLQQRITPMQADPAQAKMMSTVMPIMMTVIFYQFPSGLVLYWMVSNVLAIAHQLWIGRGMRTKQAS